MIMGVNSGRLKSPLYSSVPLLFYGHPVMAEPLWTASTKTSLWSASVFLHSSEYSWWQYVLPIKINIKILVKLDINSLIGHNLLLNSFAMSNRLDKIIYQLIRTFNFSRFFLAKKPLQEACKLMIVPVIFSSRAISSLFRAPARKNT